MHKTLIHQSIAQRHYKNLQYKIGEKDKTSYWASIHKKRKVSRRTSSKPCKWGDVARGCPNMWVKWEPGMHDIICGCLCRRCVVAVMDAIFPSPFLPLFLFLLFSFYSRANQRTLPWHGDQSWQCYPQVLSQRWEGWLVMRPPFPWPCNQRSLPWHGNQMVAMSCC